MNSKQIDEMLAGLVKRPIVVVGGKVYHYHEIEITEDDPPEPEVFPAWRDHPMYRAVYQVSFPFRLTLKTYIAPAVRDSSIWRVRRWRAESFSMEQWSSARVKPSRKRDRIVFHDAVESFPAVEHEIRRRIPSDSLPAWMLGNVRHCQYMEDNAPARGIVAPTAKLCSRPAVYAIMWLPEGFPVVENFGYICDYHRAAFLAFVEETKQNPEEYKLRRLPYEGNHVHNA